MALLTALVPDVRVEIPEAASFVAERQLLRAAREFLEESRAWRANIQISTVGGTSTVDLSAILPLDTELVDIVSIKNVDGSAPLTPRTFIWMDKNQADWRTETSLNAQWYVLELNNIIRLVPTPSTSIAGQYNLRVAVKPTLTAAVIDDVVVNKYDEVLIHGALSKLYVMPRKPWTDNNLAAFHMNAFRAAFAPARTEAAEEFQTGIPRKVKYGGL